MIGRGAAYSDLEGNYPDGGGFEAAGTGGNPNLVAGEPAGAFYRYHANDTDGVDAVSWADSSLNGFDLGDCVDAAQGAPPNLLSSTPPTGHSYWFDFSGTNEVFERQYTGASLAALNAQTEGTVLLYFKPDTLATYVLWQHNWQTPITQSFAYARVYMDASGNITLQTRDDTNGTQTRTSSTTAVNTSAWHKALVRVSAAGTAMWINGTAQTVSNSSSALWLAQVAATVTESNPLDLFTLGGYRTGGGAPANDYNGGLAYASEWPSALSDALCAALTDGTVVI